MNYYNEIDPYCVEWLSNLIREKLIPDGHIDTRDIRDVLPRDLAAYRQCHFFAGLGGWPLALATAAVRADEPLWTGSCPCQPFSAAGKRGGFADERHLWPYWHWLIAQRRPPVVLGEQVASAAQWLGLVRGDLEALDYAVGFMPVEAACAGADHLRDRYWFVAHHEHAPEGRRRLQRSGESPSAPGERASDKFAGSGHNGVALGDAHESGSQGRQLLSERSHERIAGPAGVVDATGERRRERRAEPVLRSGRHAVAESGGTLDDLADGSVGHALESSDTEWVIGADGKARRVKSGIRLLAYGIPARVAKLRAFGNAIDPRPAAAFIRAALNPP